MVKPSLVAVETRRSNWNLPTGNCVVVSLGIQERFSVTLSPDGQTAGSSDNTIKIWNLGSGKLLRTLWPFRRGYVYYPESGWSDPASGSSDNTIKIWWAVVNCFALSGHSDAISLLPSAQMARSLLVAVATQLKSGNWAVVNCFALSGHTERVIAFSPDGQP